MHFALDNINMSTSKDVQRLQLVAGDERAAAVPEAHLLPAAMSEGPVTSTGYFQSMT